MLCSIWMMNRRRGGVGVAAGAEPVQDQLLEGKAILIGLQIYRTNLTKSLRNMKLMMSHLMILVTLLLAPGPGLAPCLAPCLAPGVAPVLVHIAGA